MRKPPTEAIAYLKASVTPDELEGAVDLAWPDSPVLRALNSEGLITAYLTDEGRHFRYVQNRDLTAVGMSPEELHAQAIANLGELARGKMELQQHKSIFALFLDGNFEASLMLVDDLWDKELRDFIEGDFIAAIPSRDVLAFSSADSPDGASELEGVIARVWREADHLLSRSLFRRRRGRWMRYQPGPAQRPS